MDNFVFPGLDKAREGDGLEARFNAFKIPESNFLVFEATVRTCRDGCQPVMILILFSSFELRLASIFDAARECVYAYTRP